MSKYTKAVEHQLKGIENLNPSLCASCSDCGGKWGMEEEEFADAIENGEAFDEGSFSWSSCEGCGSILGGNRYVVHGFMDDNIIHLDVCVDCLVYLANGDEPENWEG